MAVYTNINTQETEKILQNYDIGKLKTLKPITGGVSNSNYFITTDKNKYLLTIVEDFPENLGFVLSFIKHLHENKINCPCPIADKNGTIIQSFKNKSLILVSFLEGKHPETITEKHCKTLGKSLAEMHLAGQSFKNKKPNPRLVKEVLKDKNKYLKYIDGLEQTCSNIIKKWPDNLPKGIIHADLFPDNILLKKNGSLGGIIDFYLAGYDMFAYDLAICINAWCFDGKEINKNKLQAVITEYQKIRPLSLDEISSMQILHQGASLRFLFARLDIQNPAYDPQEYIDKLNYHKNNNIGELIN